MSAGTTVSPKNDFDDRHISTDQQEDEIESDSVTCFSDIQKSRPSFSQVLCHSYFLVLGKQVF